MSTHGGSPGSGLVVPIGLEALKPALPEGMVLVPQEVVDAKRQAEERKERALQLERRRMALEIIPAVLRSGPLGETGFGYQKEDCIGLVVRDALALADELISKTGGSI